MVVVGVNNGWLAPPAARRQLSISLRLGTNLNIGTRGPQGRVTGAIAVAHQILLTHTLVHSRGGKGLNVLENKVAIDH